jgi:protein tyrosine phosphatase (PTP) superfamily phosphohydrolase (DUF442 family)
MSTHALSPGLAMSLALAVIVMAVTTSAQVQKKEVAGIVNYSRVDATVGCGGRVSPSAMAALKAEGYVSVINLRLDAAVGDTANQPVFIHCGSANRVGGLWMIKRALRDGWPVEKAQAEAEVIGLRDPKLTAFAAEYITAHR